MKALSPGARDLAKAFSCSLLGLLFISGRFTDDGKEVIDPYDIKNDSWPCEVMIRFGLKILRLQEMNIAVRDETCESGGWFRI